VDWHLFLNACHSNFLVKMILRLNLRPI